MIFQTDPTIKCIYSKRNCISMLKWAGSYKNVFLRTCLLNENYKPKSQQENLTFSFIPRRNIQGKQNCCIYELICLYMAP